MSKPTIWGIHAGRTGDAHSLFINNSEIALSWAEMPDLSTIQPNRDSFKAVVARAFPSAKPGAIPNYTVQLLRFVHEMKQGDLVVYPSKADRIINIGQVVGDYVYQGKNEAYPHRRPVKGFRGGPRQTFPRGEMEEFGHD